MKIFDEDGNFLGDFIADQKDKVSDSFDESPGDGCLCILYLIPFILIVIILYYLLKLFIIICRYLLKLLVIICKFLIRIIWWILRLPFYLIFYRETPEF